MNTSNKILLSIGIFIVTFIIVMEVTFLIKGDVPDVLIENVLDAGKWEVALLAFIKVSKLIKGEKISDSNKEDSSHDEYNY